MLFCYSLSPKTSKTLVAKTFLWMTVYICNKDDNIHTIIISIRIRTRRLKEHLLKSRMGAFKKNHKNCHVFLYFLMSIFVHIAVKSEHKWAVIFLFYFKMAKTTFLCPPKIILDLFCLVAIPFSWDQTK